MGLKNIKKRWKTETPKIYKILGTIGVVVGLLGTGLTSIWTELPVEFQSLLPLWVPTAIAFTGFLGKLVCKLQYVKELYDVIEPKILAKND